jgi:RNA-directed DNA polymerase
MTKPTISLQELRRKIGHRAKSAPVHRFWGLHVHVMKLETLEAAYLTAKSNQGAPGIDGETFEGIEAQGRNQFLLELASELRTGTYDPKPYRRREIPKEGGKVRTISIPTIRDRVVQGALRLILEPIFEADFSEQSYGGRPGRSAHQAIKRVQIGLLRRQHRVADVDLSCYFDNIRHDRMLEKVARRVQDGKVLAMVKQYLKSNGPRGIPQGSPLSPLVANVALNDLDRALDRGAGFITYVRYLDDMVVLAPDSERGRRWADRALERIRGEAEAIGVSLNAEKTRMVTVTDQCATFSFLGFDLRWVRSEKTGKWYPCTSPRPKKVTTLLRKVRKSLRMNRHLAVRDAVAQLNPIVRGWVNYFRAGHSSQAFGKVKCRVECKVRRFAAKKSKRTGFGWKRWSSVIVYGSWGLFDDYSLAYKANARASGTES